MQNKQIGKLLFVLLLILNAVVSITNASTVTEFHFPDSYEGTGTTVTDLSGNGNDCTTRAQGAGDLSTNIPGGGTGSSLDLTKTNFDTDASGILDVDDIMSAGGFAFDLWYNNNNQAPATWQTIMAHGGHIDMYLWDQGEIRFRGDGGGANDIRTQSIAGVISAAGWHHIVVQFTAESVIADTSVTGTAAIYVDDVDVTDVANSAITHTLDQAWFNTPIGFGVRGGGTANNRANGLLYDPTVLLGYAGTRATVGSLQSSGGNTICVEGDDSGTSFALVLQGDAAPDSDVIITLTPEGISADASEIQLSSGLVVADWGQPLQVTFTPANWDTPQQVTVLALDDNIAEDPEIARITCQVSGGGQDFDGGFIPNAYFTVIDDPAVPHPADFNDDNEVNNIDFAMFAQNWRKKHGFTNPAIIPAPRDIVLGGNSFDFSGDVTIVYESSEAAQVATIADYLKGILVGQNAGSVTVTQGDTASAPAGSITLNIALVDGTEGNTEAYRLEVNSDKISITAPQPEGLIWATQTVRQLIDGQAIIACEVTDWPSYRMRGVMIDVGRNFVSVNRLKNYLDLMALYKLNVFHFHLTENIAWRLEILSHPELTEAQYMQRQAGSYYSQVEVADLIDYAAKRGIMIVPEIDMPGHSDAFVRATGVTMESAAGMAILTDVLNEVCQIFDAPYIHLGSDETHITNPDFIPTMGAIVRSYGKEVVLWRPGGPLDSNAVYQLWARGTAGDDYAIDSDDTYFNHHGFFTSPVNFFNRKFADATEGSEKVMGAIACLWHDRYAASEEDVFLMSPVAQGMIALAERTWLGGGKDSQERVMAKSGTEDFCDYRAFEERMLIHRDQYWTEEPLNYVRQSDISWYVFGPFPNGGNVNAVFPPETEDLDAYSYNGQEYLPEESRGATVFFNGWAPGTGFYADSVSNSTAYVRTYVYSPVDQDVSMWIGFKNCSRSKRDATPHLGNWDYRSSKVWLNDELVAPPVWDNPGQTVGSEDPIDPQLFFYTRPPTPAHLDAGWNKLLLKAPIASSAYAKWMCTAVVGSWDGQKFRELDGIVYSPTATFDSYIASNFLSGDMNIDCCVDMEDLMQFAMRWIEVF